MASSNTETDLRRVRELRKYSQDFASRNEIGRPHEKSRVLAAEEGDYIGACDECFKFMDKVKNRYVCSCKETIHFSKACFKSSNHKCEEPWLDVQDIPEENFGPDPEKNVWACYHRELNDKACTEQYVADMIANRGPSSDKMSHFMKIIRGDHRRILKYAEAKNSAAALVIGKAYMNREFDRQAVFAIPLKYKELSEVETNKMAIQWLKVAAEGGLPEAMFLLFTMLAKDGIGLNWREGQYWLAEAHATGKMNYLSLILETPSELNFPGELDFMINQITSASFKQTYKIVACDNVEEEETMERMNSFEDIMKRYKRAGTCESCVEVAKQRLWAMALGLYSISITPVCLDWFFAARYANEDGVIVQEVFRGYSKPYIKQTLQCLMSNPQDLHPLAVAENTILFWPIIWFWGSVYGAVQDCCNKATLDAIYENLGPNIDVVKNDNASTMAAFPQVGAGEWRLACGNEDCPRVDHEVKFNLCDGCKVRRYCGSDCQRQDWSKHGRFCKAEEKEGKEGNPSK